MLKLRCALVLCFVSILFAAGPLAAQTVTGTVFRDYNADGVQGAPEPGVGGIAVTAFDATGASVGSAMTLADGTYSAALSVGAGTPVRVELSGLPGYLRPGPFGADSGTTVIFAESGDSGLDVGLANPGEHCSDTTDVATVCYVAGPHTDGDDIVVSFPETAGSNSNVNAALYDLPPHTVEAISTDVGAVWGVGYRSVSDVIYAAAFVKRHADLGATGNPTTIYQIDRGSGTVSPWITLDPARPNPHSGSVDGWGRDFAAFDDVFKQGLGDLDVSEDDSTVYTVDLGTGDLVTVAVNPDGSAGTVTRIPISSTVAAGISCPVGETRPFGLGIRDGQLYLGVVCTGQSSVDEATQLPIAGPISTEVVNRPGDRTLLEGYVFVWDGAVGFTQVVTFPLDYNRGCYARNNVATCRTPHDGRWNPWVDKYPFYDQPGQDRHNAGYPQAVISDIEFDRGSMILGLADRWGHQTGPSTKTPAYPQNEPANSEGDLGNAFSTGDMLRACASGPAAWGLEVLVDPTNPGCATPGTSSNLGNTLPLNEYYFGDDHGAVVLRHAEVPLGGLTQIPGRPQVITSAFDPIRPLDELFDGGIIWLDNTTGAWTRGYRLYDGFGVGGDPTDFFDKAAGIGDVAPLCPPAPLEVGNRVWDDLDGDGVQDPGEPGLDGVTLRLFCGGSEIATTLSSDLAGTAASGTYLFNDANVVGGIPLNTACEVRVDPADPGLGGRFATMANTGGNVGTSDLRDSDGVPSGGFVVAAFMTGGPGANDHTYDFGFTTVGPATITVDKTAAPTSLPEPGGNVTYTVTVTNDSDTLSVTITSLTDDMAGDLNGQGTCSVPQVIPPLGSYQCQYTAAVSGDPGDTITCTVTASGTDANTNPVMDSDPATVTITDVGSSITVDKSASPTSVPEPGGNVTYTVTVTNTSTVDDVTITTLTDDMAGDLNGQGTCSVPQVLSPGGVYQCQYTAAVSGNAGDTVTCTVTASGTDDDGNPVSDSDPATVTITDVGSSITVDKTASPTSLPEQGGDVTYTVTVTNTSTVDDVTITSLTDDMAGDLNGQGTCSVPQTLPPGGVYQCEYTAAVGGNAGEQITCTVTASGEDDDGNPVSDSDSATVTITDVASTITVEKSASPTTVPAPGGEVTYTVTVANTSPTDDVTITSLVDDMAGDLNGQGTCSVPQFLPPTAEYQCQYTATVTGNAGDMITCTVTASGTDDDGSPVSGSGSATVTVTDGGDTEGADLDGTKEVSGDLTPGGMIEYLLIVTNVGDAAQPDNPGPEVEDVLPPQLTLLDAVADSGTITLDLPNDTVRWDGALGVGEEVTIMISAVIAEDASGVISNQATLSFDTDGDGTNDGSDVTDDPDTGGPGNPTVFELEGAVEIPTLSHAALALFALVLLAAAAASMRRTAARQR